MILVDNALWRMFDTPLGKLYWRSALGEDPQLTDISSFEGFARNQSMNWVALFDSAEGVTALTDVTRSYPVLYAWQSEDLMVSSTPTPLMEKLNNPTLNPASAEEFLHSGYLIGDETLVNEIKSVPASSIQRISDRDSRAVTQSMPLDITPLDVDPDEFLDIFFEKLRQAFRLLLDTAGDSQLVVPLSGGLDSRLILTLLREAGAQNVVTFTYGTAGSTEVRISEQVAAALGYPWFGVEIDTEEIKESWSKPDNASFLSDTWSADALPHIQDWYALRKLTADGTIEPNAIVLPGHSVVGNVHAEELWDPEKKVSLREAADAITVHHFNLQGAQGVRDLPRSSQIKIRRYLEEHWDDDRRADVFMQFNLETRKPKYITNSVRAYENFGLRWSLPFLYQNVWESWLTSPKELRTQDRKRFAEKINRAFLDVSSGDVQLFLAPAAKLKPTTKDQLKIILSRLGLLGPLNRIHEVRSQRHHPMGFEAFATGMSERQIDRELLRGRRILGLYTKLFLANEWVKGADIVPVGRSNSESRAKEIGNDEG